MKRFFARLWTLLLSWAVSLRLQAQYYGEDYRESSPRHRDADEGLDLDVFDYPTLHIDFEDVLLVLVLLLACYVFGKIWKGCTYLLLVVAAIYIYLTRLS